MAGEGASPADVESVRKTYGFDRPLPEQYLAWLKKVFDGDFGRSVDWTNILSLGEQQRVSFARIFLRKPVLAFLDEATSSLDEENERLLYQNLRELGISFVSVGHRSTLKAFHDFLIVLDKTGGFKISELKKALKEPAVGGL